MPSEYQLTDLATKAQPEAVLIAQRESLMQWGAELKTREELDSMLTVELLPSCHLRACEIIEQAGHWIHAEKPQELLECTLNFIKDY